MTLTREDEEEHLRGRRDPPALDLDEVRARAEAVLLRPIDYFTSRNRPVFTS